MVLKRVLTRKSKLGFGKFKDETVEHILDRKSFKTLISPYYKLTSVDFTKDILDELEIVGEWVIEKPGSDRDKYVEFLKDHGYVRKRTRDSSNNLKKEQRYSKRYLQGVNHGK